MARLRRLQGATRMHPAVRSRSRSVPPPCPPLPARGCGGRHRFATAAAARATPGIGAAIPAATRPARCCAVTRPAALRRRSCPAYADGPAAPARQGTPRRRSNRGEGAGTGRCRAASSAWPLPAGHAADRYCVVHLHLACVARVPGLGARSARGREVAIGKPNPHAGSCVRLPARFASPHPASHGGPLSRHVLAKLTRTRGPDRQPVARNRHGSS
jgi:hypothetical protein